MRKGRPADPPYPGAQAPPDLGARLEDLSVTFRRRQAQAEGAGQDWGVGRGQEFVGYRPYRAGEDARALDFTLLARLGKPFVRVTRPEAQQTVTVLIDRSASMAVGPPGKWQSAVEVAVAATHVLATAGAEIRILHGDTRHGVQTRVLRKTGEWHAVARDLFEQRAEHGLGLRELLPHLPSHQDRVLVIGDLFDLEPKDVQGYLRGQTHWSLVRIVAAFEVDPPEEGPTLWLDPEAASPARPGSADADRQRYRERMAAYDEAWRAWCAHHRVTYTHHWAGQPFEEVFRPRAGARGGAL